MTVVYRRTSILESPAQTLVNTVNCVGVMGKGLAREFRAREPEMFRAYERLCKAKILEPGTLWLWKGRDNWVLNFPTKVHWRNPSKMEWIEAGLQKFVNSYEDLGITEVSFPRLGCGNGDLNWDDVKVLMERYLGEVKIPVFIHDYVKDIGLPEHVEFAASVLREERRSISTFESFVVALSRALELSDGEVGIIETGQRFKAYFGDDKRLGILTDSFFTWFDEEDLRCIWMTLQNGLLTSRNAEWTVKGSGSYLVGVMGMLPDVRPIEIQRHDSAVSEIAIEKCYRSGSYEIARSEDQPSFAWL